MNTMFNAIVVVQVISALAIIALVLLQHGKGADMGAAFGSGASGSLFGASGSSNFMSKATAVAAAIFFVATLALSYLGTQRAQAIAAGAGVMERAKATVPAAASAAVVASAPAPVAASAAASASAPVQIPK